MKLIAIEEHFLTSEVQEAWASVAGGDDGTAPLNGGQVGERLADLGEMRLRLMDETGVDIQVLSLTAPGLNNLDGRSVGLAQRTNDLLATTIAAHPARFQGLASLPMPVPGEAARELARSVGELGLKGAVLSGRVRDRNLDHTDYWSIFECATELGVPLLLHPQIPQERVRDAYYSGFGNEVDLALATYGIGWHYEAGVQFVRMVLAGVFDRFPQLQIILGHWGEVVLFYVERLAMLNRTAKLERPFMDYVQNNLYVTASGLFSQGYLQRSVEIVGIDRILFSTDYPYVHRAGGGARRYLEEATLDELGMEKFAHANWERLTNRSSIRSS
ncbi:amidohydrolase family protein [Bradyrhizobium canariense]|uniref:amidohydrolase family protein n=1 Tax=Bradyrhizobium canariense TaxID=255045 RepID=UPI001B8A135E|nr:amidohydrolase family protein [Bradyrhizobium canariense]MBR0955016.1 amidohydrolase [Bradyrhizobium canariense]